MDNADQILEINDIGALDAYADQWHALLGQTADASFFQTFDWLKVYWAHYGETQTLRVCIVVRDGAVRGIVPLVVRRDDKRVATVRVLTFPLHDWGSFYGPVGPDPGSLLYAALKHIHATARDWDLMDLRWLRGDGEKSLATAGRHAMQRVGLRVHSRLHTETAVVDTTGDWEDYLASRKQKFRGSIRRYERRLAERGDLAFERYRPAGSVAGNDDPRWDDYDQFVALASRSWQGSSTDGTTLSHDNIAKFLRDAHVVAANCGYLDMNMLRLDGRLIAFGYNYHYNGHVSGLRIGYDPEYASLGAGKILWARSFQDSFQRDDRLYEIGSTSLSIKKNWWTRVIPICGYTYYPPFVPKTQLLRLVHWVKDLQQEPPMPFPTEA